MARALFIRTAHGLMIDSADERSQFILRGIPLGASVQVEITRPRNINRHRLFWALASAIAQAIPGSLTAENIVEILKIETGHCTIVRGKRDTYRLPKSIAFHKMEEPEFQAFMDRCFQFICSTWLPHLKPSGLRSEIEQMVGMGAIAHAEA
jgi:hypothetical protein